MVYLSDMHVNTHRDVYINIFNPYFSYVQQFMEESGLRKLKTASEWKVQKLQ